jgi:hypothetical protein
MQPPAACFTETILLPEDCINRSKYLRYSCRMRMIELEKTLRIKKASHSVWENAKPHAAGKGT